MKKRYTIVTNMTFHHNDGRDARYTVTEWVKMSKKDVARKVETWKSEGKEYLIGKNQLTVMEHVTC